MSSKENRPLSSNDQATAHHDEGIRLASMGNLAEAIKHFHAAVQMRPDDPIWQFNYGLAFQHLKQLPNAITAYRTAVQLKPDFFDAWSNLSAALKAAGQSEAAVEAGGRP